MTKKQIQKLEKNIIQEIKETIQGFSQYRETGLYNYYEVTSAKELYQYIRYKADSDDIENAFFACGYIYGLERALEKMKVIIKLIK